MTETNFWHTMADLAASKPIVIDRPKGTAHPSFPEAIYPFSYGYVEGTLAADGGGIDVWIGSQGNHELSGILCTYDTRDRDAEIKLLLGCTNDDVQVIIGFHSSLMAVLHIPRPKENQ